MSAQQFARLARLPSTDPDFYRREYNNRELVPDHGSNLAWWAELSRQVRARQGWHADLPYGKPGSPHERDENLDYFPAAPAAGRPPLLLFLHGGYWKSLDKHDHSFVAHALPAAGVSIAVANYSLCPAVTIGTIVDQTAQCLAWLYREAERLGHDPDRIYVAGHSAGGHLAATMLTVRWPALAPDLPADLLQGALSISGLHDLEPMRRADFLQTDLRLTDEEIARLSPAFLAPATDAPLFTAVGGDESSEFHRQNALIRAAWPRNAGVDVPMPGRNHFTAPEALADDHSALFRAVLELVGAVQPGTAAARSTRRQPRPHQAAPNATSPEATS